MVSIKEIRATLLEDAGRSKDRSATPPTRNGFRRKTREYPDVAMRRGKGRSRDGPVNPATGISPASDCP